MGIVFTILCYVERHPGSHHNVALESQHNFVFRDWRFRSIYPFVCEPGFTFDCISRREWAKTDNEASW